MIAPRIGRLWPKARLSPPLGGAVLAFAAVVWAMALVTDGRWGGRGSPLVSRTQDDDGAAGTESVVPMRPVYYLVYSQ
jgi:hypothetical protein